MKKFSKQRLVLTLLLASSVMPVTVNTGIKTTIGFCIGIALIYKHSNTLQGDILEIQNKFQNATTTNAKLTVLKKATFQTVSAIENDGLEALKKLTNWRLEQKQNQETKETIEKYIENQKEEITTEVTTQSPNAFVKEELLKSSLTTTETTEKN